MNEFKSIRQRHGTLRVWATPIQPRRASYSPSSATYWLSCSALKWQSRRRQTTRTGGRRERRHPDLKGGHLRRAGSGNEGVRMSNDDEFPTRGAPMRSKRIPATTRSSESRARCDQAAGAGQSTRTRVERVRGLAVPGVQWVGFHQLAEGGTAAPPAALDRLDAYAATDG